MCSKRRFRSPRAFAQSDQNLPLRILDRQGYIFSSCGQRRLRSDCADAQADLRLRLANMTKGTFSHVEVHICLHYIPSFCIRFFCPDFRVSGGIFVSFVRLRSLVTKSGLSSPDADFGIKYNSSGNTSSSSSNSSYCTLTFQIHIVKRFAQNIC